MENNDLKPPTSTAWWFYIQGVAQSCANFKQVYGLGFWLFVGLKNPSISRRNRIIDKTIDSKSQNHSDIPHPVIEVSMRTIHPVLDESISSAAVAEAAWWAPGCRHTSTFLFITFMFIHMMQSIQVYVIMYVCIYIYTYNCIDTIYLFIISTITDCQYHCRCHYQHY